MNGDVEWVGGLSMLYDMECMKSWRLCNYVSNSQLQSMLSGFGARFAVRSSFQISFCHHDEEIHDVNERGRFESNRGHRHS